jgi:hypothetical protein
MSGKIRIPKGYSYNLIVHAHLRLDDPPWLRANDGRGVAGPRWWRHWSSSELGSPSPLVSETCRVFILRGLEHERNPISILTAVEIDGGRLASAARFGQPLATASSSSEASPARRVGSQAS